MRYSNISDVKEYIEKIFNCAEIKVVEEILNRERAIEEFCFLSLRKSEGIDKSKFKNKFGVEIKNIYEKKINSLTQKKLIEESKEKIKLTQLGMKYGNYVFGEFLIESI